MVVLFGKSGSAFQKLAPPVCGMRNTTVVFFAMKTRNMIAKILQFLGYQAEFAYFWCYEFSKVGSLFWFSHLDDISVKTALASFKNLRGKWRSNYTEQPYAGDHQSKRAM